MDLDYNFNKNKKIRVKMTWADMAIEVFSIIFVITPVMLHIFLSGFYKDAKINYCISYSEDTENGLIGY